MKILYIITSLHRGGAELVLQDIVSGLHQQYEQKVLFFYDGPVRISLEERGIGCIKVSFWWCRYDPIFCMHLLFLIIKHRPAVMVSSLWAANFFARCIGFFLAIPVINCLHAQPEHEGALRNFLDRYTFGAAHQLVAVSEELARRCKEKYQLPDQKLLVIKNGITIVRTRDIKKNNVIKIGAVGRFVPVKNFALLIHAFHQLSHLYNHIELIIVGGGPLEQELRALITALDLNHRITLHIDQDAQLFFPHFDIFVQPSWSEGLSRALLEALAHRLPVIVSGTKKNHALIVHQQHGLIIDPSELTELIDALHVLLNNHDIRKKYAENGYNLVAEHYSVQHMIKNYKHLIDSFRL